MLLGCPTCKTRYKLDDSRVRTDRILLQCCRCRTVFRIAGKVPSTPPVSLEAAPARTGKPVTVLVANESPDFCALVKRVLGPEPFTVLSCHDGKEAMDLVEEHLPDVVLLDVALPTMYGFEICEKIKNTPALSSIRTILIASIYDKTRYKREPQSLYGADDYIEKHHIPDSLAAKIYRAVFGQTAVERSEDDSVSVEEEKLTAPATVTVLEMETQDLEREEIRRDEEEKTCSTDSGQLNEAHEKAQRLARIIITDIALYNQKKVEEGVLNDTFHELFAEELAEGRIYYEQRVPDEVREGTSYLDDALKDFVSQKKSELNR